MERIQQRLKELIRAEFSVADRIRVVTDSDMLLHVDG